MLPEALFIHSICSHSDNRSSRRLQANPHMLCCPLISHCRFPKTLTISFVMPSVCLIFIHITSSLHIFISSFRCTVTRFSLQEMASLYNRWHLRFSACVEMGAISVCHGFCHCVCLCSGLHAIPAQGGGRVRWIMSIMHRVEWEWATITFCNP